MNVCNNPGSEGERPDLIRLRGAAELDNLNGEGIILQQRRRRRKLSNIVTENIIGKKKFFSKVATVQICLSENSFLHN